MQTFLFLLSFPSDISLMDTKQKQIVIYEVLYYTAQAL